MNKMRITIEGQEYPSYVTMGAFLEFRDATGAEANDRIASGKISDIVTWLWACTRSASRREGNPMKLGLRDFADRLGVDGLNAWAAAMAEENARTVGALHSTTDAADEDSKKKIRRGSGKS